MDGNGDPDSVAAAAWDVMGTNLAKQARQRFTELNIAENILKKLANRDEVYHHILYGGSFGLDGSIDVTPEEKAYLVSIGFQEG